MQFKEGTPVYTADGDKVGDIERFVLDPRAKQITGLVVRKGFLFTEDKVVPIDSVASTSEDRVVLHSHAGDADSFPIFEEMHYLTPDEIELRDGYRQRFVGPVYHFPPIGIAPWYGVGVDTAPTVPITERNIPEESVPLRTGAKVISRDGEHVGDIEEIYTGAGSGEITHFAITQGLLFKDRKVLPASWVSLAEEDRVHLAVGTKTLEHMSAN